MFSFFDWVSFCLKNRGGKAENTFFYLSYTRPSLSVSSSEIAKSENLNTESSDPVTDSERFGKREKIGGGFVSPLATACLCARVLMHSAKWSAATIAFTVIVFSSGKEGQIGGRERERERERFERW